MVILFDAFFEQPETDITKRRINTTEIHLISFLLRIPVADISGCFPVIVSSHLVLCY